MGNIMNAIRRFREEREKQKVDRMMEKCKVLEEGDSSEEELDDNGVPKVKHVHCVETSAFDTTMGIAIFVNAITIGLETDDTLSGGENAGLWIWAEVGFCILFVVEVSAKLYYKRLEFFTDIKDRGWNIVDFIIAIMSLVDTFILSAILNSAGSIRIVQLLRFVRLLRLIRLVRLFKTFHALWFVASGFMEAMSVVVWVVALLVIVVFMAATFTSYAIGDNDELYDPYFLKSGWDHELYFKTVRGSMFTLIQIVTLDDWNEGIVRHVVDQQPYMVLFFFVFLVVTSFGFTNIIVAVVVQRTFKTAEKDQARQTKEKEKEIKFVLGGLRDVFEAADLDGSGTLTIEEVVEAMNSPDIYNKLRMIGFPVEDPYKIFDLLDFDGSGELTIDEFILGCVRIRGDAKAKDLLVAQVSMDALKEHCDRYEEVVEGLADRISNIKSLASLICDQGERCFLSQQQYRMRNPTFMQDKVEVPQFSKDEILASPWFSVDSKLVRSVKEGFEREEQLVNFSDRDTMIQYGREVADVVREKRRAEAEPPLPPLLDEQPPPPPLPKLALKKDSLGSKEGGTKDHATSGLPALPAAPPDPPSALGPAPKLPAIADSEPSREQQRAITAG